jgi:hypothetical protein
MDESHDDVCRLQSTNKYIFCGVWNHEKEAFRSTLLGKYLTLSFRTSKSHVSMDIRQKKFQL